MTVQFPVDSLVQFLLVLIPYLYPDHLFLYRELVIRHHILLGHLVGSDEDEVVCICLTLVLIPTRCLS